MWKILWQLLHYGILPLELGIIAVGIWMLYTWRGGKSIRGITLPLVIAVFVLNLGLYSLPWMYEITLNHSVNWGLELAESIACTIKQFVGETHIDRVLEYAKLFPLYNWMFGLGFVLAITTTFGAAVLLFGKRFLNRWKVHCILTGDNCDIVVGNSAAALFYAKQNPNTVLLLDDTIDADSVKALMESGYRVLQKKISAELFSSRLFRAGLRYNIIFPHDDNNFSEDLNIIFSCLEQKKPDKKLYFYIELDEKVMEIVQNEIDARETDKPSKTGAEKKAYREHITVFSRNELIARNFVEQYPITLHMEKNCFTADTSVRPDVKLNVFFLGFGSLSRELYRQFAINNQLATVVDGKYCALPIQYTIYDDKADSREWMLDGLKNELEEMKQNKDCYLPIPEMPYYTECICENLFGTDCIKKICSSIKESNLSYVIIDTGDVYRNIEIGNKLELFLGECRNFHLFVRNDTKTVRNDENTTYYGNPYEIFTHDIIVHESLLKLAKAINQEYHKRYNDPDGTKYTPEELEQNSLKEWEQSNYFTIYSNISLATNLRLKLNLLGLDYCKERQRKKGKVGKITTFSNSEKAYSKCLQLNKRSALLAQEHFRWNAYHLLNGYLPNELSRIGVELKNTRAKSVHKYEAGKRHGCLTTYHGVHLLSERLAELANQLCPGENYTAEQFDFYKNDDLLLDIASEYLAQNGYLIYEKNI